MRAYLLAAAQAVALGEHPPAAPGSYAGRPNTCLGTLGGMPPPMQPWDLERIRRSVVMAAPRHPGALSRETALEVISQLEDLQGRHNRIRQLLEELRPLLRELRTLVEPAGTGPAAAADAGAVTKTSTEPPDVSRQRRAGR